MSASDKRARGLANYAVEVHRPERGDWIRIVTDKRGHCEGYFECHRAAPGPRLAARVVQVEPFKVLAGAPACDRVALGMTAGSPTAEQYRAAGTRAFALADAADAATARALRSKPCS